MTEDREQSRIAHRMVARFEAKGKSAIGAILNFSETGFFVQSDALLPIGEIGTFQIGSGEKKLVVQGKVVWWRKDASSVSGIISTGMGVSLLATPPEYLGFVEEMRKKRSEPPRSRDEHFEAYHRVHFQSGESFLTEYTENLSRGGMYLATLEPLQPGSIIHAELEIPGLDEPLKVEGKVSYRLDEKGAQDRGRAMGVGIQFVKLSPDAQSQLHHYVKRLEIHRATPERRLTGAIPTSGSLSDFLVPEILFDLLDKKLTGSLRISHEDVVKTVYLKNGHPIYVESSLRSEVLSYYLIRQGKLKKEDLDASLKQLAKSEMRHGEVLLQNGLIDNTTLATALVAHQEEKLSNTFAWFNGTFEVSEEINWPENVSIFPLQTYQIIFEGISRWYDAPLISAWMGLHEKSVLGLDAEPPPDIRIPPQAFRALRRISNPVAIEELATEMGISIDECLPIAFALIVAGWANLSFTDETKKSAPPIITPEEPSPARPTAPAVTSESLDLLYRRVEEDFNRLSSLNFFELLRISPEDDETKVEQAFIAQSRRYQVVDIAQVEDADTQNKIQQILSWFRLAYDTLRDPHLRGVFERNLKLRDQKEHRADDIAAERELLAGIRSLEKKDPEQALTIFEGALKSHPKDTLIMGYLGWALYLNAPQSNLTRATELLERALTFNPTEFQLHYYRGKILDDLEDWPRAARYFSKAVRLNPQFAEAAAAFEAAQTKRIAREQSSQRVVPPPPKRTSSTTSGATLRPVRFDRKAKMIAATVIGVFLIVFLFQFIRNQSFSNQLRTIVPMTDIRMTDTTLYATVPREWIENIPLNEREDQLRQLAEQLRKREIYGVVLSDARKQPVAQILRQSGHRAPPTVRMIR